MKASRILLLIASLTVLCIGLVAVSSCSLFSDVIRALGAVFGVFFACAAGYSMRRYDEIIEQENEAERQDARSTP